ncbi:MAG: hypothetical protein OXE50_02200 [Chloroflexi bacterium]|nr:hypothetical protein [Chloroflexota bacterium]
MTIARRISRPTSRTTLPLRDVDFDLAITDSDLGSGVWPPPRYLDRNNRLLLLWQMWEGDLSGLVEYNEDVQLPVNLFRRVSTSISDLLLMSEIEAAIDLAYVAYNAIIDMPRFGGAVLWAGVNVEGEPFLSTVLPPYWYAHEDGGHVFILPYVSSRAPSPLYDRAEVVHVEPSGFTYSQDRGFNGRTFTSAPAEAVTNLGTSAVFIVPRAPVFTTWGTALYNDLAAPVLEISKRFTANDDSLDKNQRPVLLWWEDQSDIESRFLPRDDDGMEIIDPTDAQKAEAIIMGLEAARRESVLAIPNTATKAEYLTWDGSLAASFTQIEASKEIMNILSGIAVLLSRNESPMSGTALKLQNQPLYAMTRAMQNDLRTGLEAALSYVLGGEQAVTWEHPWDADDGEVQEPELEDPEEDV